MRDMIKKKKKNTCRPLSAVSGYMVATPLLAMVEQGRSNFKLPHERNMTFWCDAPDRYREPSD